MKISDVIKGIELNKLLKKERHKTTTHTANVSFCVMGNSIVARVAGVAGTTEWPINVDSEEVRDAFVKMVNTRGATIRNRMWNRLRRLGVGL